MTQTNFLSLEDQKLRVFVYSSMFFFHCLFLEKDENKRRSSKSPGIKCVVVGDGTAGKTNLIQSYLLDSYVHDSSYIPTAFDKYNGEYIDVSSLFLNITTICT